MQIIEDETPKGGKIAIFQNVKERLLTLEGAKEFYAEVLENFTNNMVSERSMRAIVYLMSSYINYLKLEKDCRIEERIEAIEKAIEEAKA